MNDLPIDELNTLIFDVRVYAEMANDYLNKQKRSDEAIAKLCDIQRLLNKHITQEAKHD